MNKPKYFSNALLYVFYFYFHPMDLENGVENSANTQKFTTKPGEY